MKLISGLMLACGPMAGLMYLAYQNHGINGVIVAWFGGLSFVAATVLGVAIVLERIGNED